MSTSTIGIKIADGSFYPILSGEGGKNKRLVLTTVRDNQESVQIDLYQGRGERLEDAGYIGSLVIENIQDALKGDPEIELIIGVDADGTLNATAGDKATGEKQSLSVSLTAFDESDVYDMPDFEIEDSLGGVTPEEEHQLTSETYMEEDEEDLYTVQDREKKKHPFLLIGFIILGLAVIIIIALLLFKNLKGPEVPPLEAGGSVPVETVENETPEESPAVETASQEPGVSEPAAEPDVQAEPEVAAEPPAEESPPVSGGVWYTISWGDTLWDISNAFYQTPWLYPFIAEENEIRNPDFILADSSIYIPAR